jgi:hypothetical protein
MELKMQKILLKSLIAISTLSLAACGGGSGGGSTKEQPTPSTQPITALTVAIDKQTPTLDENVTAVIKADVNYNGTSDISFSYDVVDVTKSEFISASYANGEITLKTVEVLENTDVELSVTFSDGSLNESTKLTVSINDVANNYIINTVNGEEDVRGNPSELSFSKATLLVGETLTFPQEDLLSLSFAEFETPYIISLDTLDSVTTSNAEIIGIDQAANKIKAMSIGTAIIEMSFAGVTKEFAVEVKTSTPVISGQLSYQRINFSDDGSGFPGNKKFDIQNPTTHPVRKIVVNLLDEDKNLLTSTVSDDTGSYSFELTKTDIDKAYHIELLAQLELDSEVNDGFKILVTDQSTAVTLTEQNIYSYATPIFNLSNGVNSQDVALTVGWNDQTKTFDVPQAQPFAILDTVYKTATYLASGGVNFDDSLDDLYINWSQAEGSVERQAAFYNPFENRIFLNGEKVDWASIEEYSEVVISHEFTHYYQKKILGRDDSTGGAHAHWDTTQLTIAFSEGLAQAIAYATHNEWQDKRPQSDVEASMTFDDYYVIAQDELAGNCITTKTKFDGTNVTFNCHRFSPWEEVTNSLFILSLISDRDETPRTANLTSFVGISGLHQALSEAVKSDAYMSVYSLASALKATHSNDSEKIDLLANKLDFNLENVWGGNQTTVASHMLDDVTSLDTTSYLPVYVNVAESSTKQVCFNGGLLSTSVNRPGTSRYVKFKAESDGMVLIRVEDTVDVDGNTHSYEFYSYYKGQTPELANLFPNGRLDEAEFMAYEGKEYVIDIRGRRYEEQALFTDIESNSYLIYPYAKDETVCTNVTITKQ